MIAKFAFVLLFPLTLVVSSCASSEPVVIEWNQAQCPMGAPIFSMISCEGQRAMLEAEKRDGEPLELRDQAALTAFLEGEGLHRIASTSNPTSEGVFWSSPGARCPREVALKRIYLPFGTIAENRTTYQRVLKHNQIVASSDHAPEALCEPEEDTSVPDPRF